MSISSSLQMASNSLRANQIALQVIGQNIANVNTPGYIREEIVLTPAPTQKVGGLLLGLGVEVKAVVQKIDMFLEQRLRGAISDYESSSAQSDTYAQLEGLLGELSDADLSTAMNNLFSSISEVLNQPENVSTRNLAMLQGRTLTQDITRLASRVDDLRKDVNDQVAATGEAINRLTEEIKKLNILIAETEGGDVSESDAVGLRDRRLAALESLAKLIEIRVREQTSGAVSVYCGGDFLVVDGIRQEVKIVEKSDRGMTISDVRIKDTDSPLSPNAGELCGLKISRDTILAGFSEQLDSFANTLIFEFNKAYSKGQGLKGFDEVKGDYAAYDTTVALDEAGLKFTPENGSFELLVYNKKTKLTQTTEILVDLNGGAQDLTLDELCAELDAISGISSSITLNKELTITSDSVDQEFAFANDTSGVLAALGINTFFSGTGARDMGINSYVADDPALFAASRGGIAVDTENAIDLAAFLDQPLDSQNGATLAVLYDRMTGEMTQGSSVARAVAEGAKVFEDTLRGQKMSVSGVSLDEEAVRMISYQRAFQASARFIGTLSDLFELLVAL